MHFGDGNIPWVDTMKYFGIVTSNSFISGYHVALLPPPRTGVYYCFCWLVCDNRMEVHLEKLGGKTECVNINTFT